MVVCVFSRLYRRSLIAAFMLLALLGSNHCFAEPDRQVLTRPGQIRLAGFLQPRLIANARSRLLAADEGAMLSGFEHRPGRQARIGEHVGKWLHAASLAWAYTGDHALRAKMDRVVARLIRTQQADGYLGTYLPNDRWTSWDVWVHKYVLIGLLSYYERTGEMQALDAAKKTADLLLETFGSGRRDIIASGTHVGMAATSVLEPIILLYRTTGDVRYLDFARYIVSSWDQPNGPKIIQSLLSTGSVAQTANGKAYELMSNLVGLCELSRTVGDRNLLRPVLAAWRDIVSKRMYITGGTSFGEYFQKDYYLPNEGEVAETCATVTWLQLNLELLCLSNEPIFADVIEKIVYNHLLGAQHPYAATFCYFTPLAGRKVYRRDLNCCLSSGPRGVALIPTFAYTLIRDGFCINLYNTGTASLSLPNRDMVVIHQQTLYPIDGGVQLTVNPTRPTRFTIALRIPSWCPSAVVRVTQGQVAQAKPGTYHYLRRVWRPGDRIALRMSIPAVLIRGQHTNAGLAAVRRGPVVLCADEDLNPKIRPISQAAIDTDAVAKLRPARQTGTGEVRERVFALPGFMLRSTGATAHTLYLTDFASAGANGGAFTVWLHLKPKAPRPASSAP
ncbi:MAG: glycoside hydrolase family 127 protein [Armatimonadota bacterium]